MKKSKKKTNNIETKIKRSIFSKRHAHILKDLLLTIIAKKVAD